MSAVITSIINNEVDNDGGDDDHVLAVDTGKKDIPVSSDYINLPGLQNVPCTAVVVLASVSEVQ